MKEFCIAILKNFNSNFDFNVATIFNRLSVIDLSEDAMQPMYSESSNTMILFNGEIYNYKELERIRIKRVKI